MLRSVLLALCVLAVVASAKPFKRPLGGFQELGPSRLERDGLNPRRFRKEFSGRNPLTGETVSISYNVEHPDNLYNLYHDERVEDVSCDADLSAGTVTLTTPSPEAARELAEEWRAGDLLSGGAEWGCLHPDHAEPKSFQFRITATGVLDGDRVTFAVSRVSPLAGLKNAELRLSTGGAPPIVNPHGPKHVPTGEIEMEDESGNPIDLGGEERWFSDLGDASVGTALNGVVQWNYDPRDEIELYTYTYEITPGVDATTAITCTDCWAEFTTENDIYLLVEDFELKVLRISSTNDAYFNVLIEESIELDIDLDWSMEILSEVPLLGYGIDLGMLEISLGVVFDLNIHGDITTPTAITLAVEQGFFAWGTQTVVIECDANKCLASPEEPGYSYQEFGPYFSYEGEVQARVFLQPIIKASLIGLADAQVSVEPYVQANIAADSANSDCDAEFWLKVGTYSWWSVDINLELWSITLFEYSTGQKEIAELTAIVWPTNPADGYYCLDISSGYFGTSDNIPEVGSTTMALSVSDTTPTVGDQVSITLDNKLSSESTIVAHWGSPDKSDMTTTGTNVYTYYTIPGTFTIVLTTKDTAGNIVRVASVTVTVAGPPSVMSYLPPNLPDETYPFTECGYAGASPADCIPTGLPLNVEHRNLRLQALYTASELDDSGIEVNAPITKICLDVEDQPAINVYNLRVAFKWTLASYLSTAAFSDTEVTWYNPAVSVTTSGYLCLVSTASPHIIMRPDATSNLVIEFSQDAAVSTSNSGASALVDTGRSYAAASYFSDDDLSYDEFPASQEDLSTGLVPKLRLYSCPANYWFDDCHYYAEPVEGSYASTLKTQGTQRFYGFGDGSKVIYTWDFGDGSAIESGSVVDHDYKWDGEYEVKMWAANAINSLSDTLTVTITGKGSPPESSGLNVTEVAKTANSAARVGALSLGCAWAVFVAVLVFL